MINSQSKSLGIKVSSLTKTEANTQNSLNNTNDFDYRLKVRHVVDTHTHIYIYILTSFRTFRTLPVKVKTWEEHTCTIIYAHKGKHVIQV